MHIKSYAKINLGLYITGKRDNGFHELYSFFQEISLHDTLNISYTNDGKNETRLSSNRNDIPLNSSNTVYKAVEALRPYFQGSVDIFIEKQVPSEAGLGGGSSNAAYTLKGLNELLNLNLSKEELHNIGAEIGSDVPFFIYGKQALVEGRGEFIRPVQVSLPYHILLLKPHHLAFSTKEIFGNYAPFLNQPINKDRLDTMLSTPTASTIQQVENHLERPILARYPLIKKMKDDLLSHGAFYSAMTGSGSVVFGLFQEKPRIPEHEAYSIFYCEPVV